MLRRLARTHAIAGGDARRQDDDVAGGETVLDLDLGGAAGPGAHRDALGAPVAQQQLAQAEANLAIAEKDARRQEDLFRQGFIGAARLDEVRRTLAVAQAQATTARANAAANRDDGSERRLLDDQLAQARAARDAAAARLTQTRIVAPAAGVVLDRAVEPGDVVQPGKRLLGLLQDGEFKLTALIDEKNLALLKPGQPAIAAADAYPAQRFRATLDYLAPGVDLQRGTVEAKFRVPEPPALLRADMTVSIDIEVAARPNARVVPAAALRGPVGEAPWVLALRAGRADLAPLRDARARRGFDGLRLRQRRGEFTALEFDQRACPRCARRSPATTRTGSACRWHRSGSS